MMFGFGPYTPFYGGPRERDTIAEAKRENAQRARGSKEFNAKKNKEKMAKKSRNNNRHK